MGKKETIKKLREILNDVNEIDKWALESNVPGRIIRLLDVVYNEVADLWYVTTYGDLDGRD